MEKQLKILIAEDDPQIGFIVKSILEERGHSVVLVDNGLSLRVKTQMFTPDVIMLDVIMPQADGYEALEDLKSENETANIPVIMVTGMNEDRERSLKAGAGYFLTKPVKAEELIAVVEKAAA